MRAIRWRPRRAGNDRGAVAPIVAVLVAGGVLLGFAALVVDIGQIYVERAELQSSADSAAMAVARACSVDDPDCTRNRIGGLAQRYVNANSSDGVSRLVEVCGRPQDLLPECSSPAENLTACLGAPPPAPTNYVEIRVATEVPGNRFVLDPAFAQAMVGGPGGTSVGACARAVWDPAQRTEVLAMTISVCELDEMASGERHTIYFHPSESTQPPCGPNPPGAWQRPGEPGWLAGAAQCMLTMPSGGIVAGDSLQPPGFRPSQACVEKLADLSSDQGDVWVPVHDAWRPQPGEGAEYRHVSVVPVRIVGFYFGSGVAEPQDDPPCSDDDRCVQVEVTGPAQPLSVLIGGAIVKLVG